MDIDQSLKVLEQQNRKLFGPAHTWAIVAVIAIVAILLALTIPAGAAILITAIIAFFVLFHYVGYAITKVNARTTLLETKFSNANKAKE